MNWLCRIKHKKLTPAAIWNAFSVLVRLVASYITNKIIVIYLGPAGTALTEQLRNFLNSVQGLASLGINEGVINYTAQYSSRPMRLTTFLASVYRFIMYSSIIVMLLIFLFAGLISEYLFHSRDYIFIIYAVAVFVPIYAYQFIIMAVLNGLQKYRYITVLNALTHLTGMVLTALFVSKMMLTGAFLSIILLPLLVFGMTVFLLGSESRNILLLPLTNGKNGGHTNNFKRLYPYIFMALTTAVVVPNGNIAVRNEIIRFFGSTGDIQAGYWDAIRKLSAFAFMFIVPIYNMYYLPELSQIKEARKWRRHIFEMVKHIYLPFIVFLLLLYLFKENVTVFIFSHAYDPMNALYGFQFAGDIVRMFSLLLAYKLWIDKQVNFFIFSEVSYWILYYVLTLWLLPAMGLKGVLAAYIFSNVFYLILLLFKYGKAILN